MAVGADHGIAVGQSLGAAGVVKEATDMGIVDAPSDGTIGSKFDGFVPVGEIGQSVAVGEADGGERPVTSFASAEFGNCLLYTSPSPRDRG